MKNAPKAPKQINIDSQDMLGHIQKLPSLIDDSYRLGQYVKVTKQVNKILIVGMGGSSIAGELLKTYLEDICPLPIFVVRNYTLPKFIDDKTLCFACSYSGNTEETLGAYREARKRNCQIVVITSGGKLMKAAEADRLQIVPIPKGIQPRAAFEFCFFPMLATLENARIIPPQSKHVKEVVNQLRKPGYGKIAKDIAQKIYGQTPIIYASEKFSEVAYRWKTQFCENSKILAYHHVFPEMNHNELTGFENPQGKFHVILFKSVLDHRRVQKKMKICEKIFKRTAGLTVFNLKGQNLITEIFSATYTGDLVSYYLALMYKVDPSPVKLVEELKKEMGPFV